MKGIEISGRWLVGRRGGASNPYSLYDIEINTEVEPNELSFRSSHPGTVYYGLWEAPQSDAAVVIAGAGSLIAGDFDVVAGPNDAEFADFSAIDPGNYSLALVLDAGFGQSPVYNVEITLGSGIAPVNTAVPTISGTAAVGQTLTATTGTWTGDPTITYAYQWQRGTTNIGGATSSTYMPILADVGSTLRCRVTATNGAGSAEAFSSNTATVANVAPSLVATASTTGATATIPAGVQTGDLIVVVADNAVSNTPADVAGWTKVAFSSGTSRLAYYHKVSDGTETELATVNGARCHAMIFRHPGGTPTVGNVTNLTISNSTTAQLPANTGFTGAEGTSLAFRSVHRRSEYTEAQRDEGPSGYTRIGSLPATGTASGLTAYISDADVASASAWASTNTSGAFNTIGITMEVRAPV